MPELIHAAYSSSGVVALSGVPMPTLTNWVTRGRLVGHRIAGGGKGRARIFTFNNVVEVSMASALIAAGVTDLASVFPAVASYSHFGEGPLTGTPNRLPGLPFHHKHGQTLFAMAGTQTCEVVLGDDGGTSALARMQWKLGRPDAFAVVNASTVLRTILDRFKASDNSQWGTWFMPLNDLLDAAYPEGHRD